MSERVNILMVDDQPANLRALEAILHELDQNLIKASSGQEALKCLLRHEFAVILMDVVMPGMDGLETAALIRERDRSRHTPIIFLTAYERTDVQMFKGYSLGAVDFLCKPLVPAVLRSKVSVFVELSRKTDQIKRQAEMLREKERQEHENRLAAEKQRWEMERLRQDAEKDQQTKRILTQKAEELSRLNRAIQDADRRKDEFLAMLGHELRNPLAPLSNALHVLRQKDNEPAVVDEMYDILHRQVKHMSRLIDDLLDVSRISRGTIELRTQQVDLREIITYALESVRPLIEERGHELEMAVPEQPLWLEADPTRLEQVLANLLNNAAKYTQPAGRLRLAVTASRQDANGRRIRFGSHSIEQDDVLITVQDNGIGIPPDMLERVFELFTRVDPSLSSSSQWGMGIGLALVRTIVGLHGGTVRALSAGNGQGSTFEVRLPLLATVQERSEPPETSQVPPPQLPPVNLLVVDDNEAAVHSMAVLLRKMGHQVGTAHNGLEALEAVRTQLPDLVLLDIGLPDMNGYEVARRIKEEEASHDILLVALTGYGQQEDVERSRAAGIDYHLVKPVDLAALANIFETVKKRPCAAASSS